MKLLIEKSTLEWLLEIARSLQDTSEAPGLEFYDWGKICSQLKKALELIEQNRKTNSKARSIKYDFDEYTANWIFAKIQEKFLQWLNKHS